MLDPSRGVGTYVCAENATCCDYLDFLRAKCTIVDGVPECLYHRLEGFVVNMTVQGNQVLVDCEEQLELTLLGLFLVMWVVSAGVVLLES